MGLIPSDLIRRVDSFSRMVFLFYNDLLQIFKPYDIDRYIRV